MLHAQLKPDTGIFLKKKQGSFSGPFYLPVRYIFDSPEGLVILGFSSSLAAFRRETYTLSQECLNSGKFLAGGIIGSIHAICSTDKLENFAWWTSTLRLETNLYRINQGPLIVSVSIVGGLSSGAFEFDISQCC